MTVANTYETYFRRFSAINGHRRHSTRNFFVFPPSNEQFIESSACCANFASGLEIDYCGFALRSLFPLTHDFFSSIKASRTIIEWQRRNFFRRAIETDSIMWPSSRRWRGTEWCMEFNLRNGFFIARRREEHEHVQLINSRFFVPNGVWRPPVHLARMQIPLLSRSQHRHVSQSQQRKTTGRVHFA